MPISREPQVSDLGFCDRETANLGLAQHSPRRPTLRLTALTDRQPRRARQRHHRQQINQSASTNASPTESPRLRWLQNTPNHGLQG